jgi:acyl transferase domain-containing protein/acyl carrier protein
VSNPTQPIDEPTGLEIAVIGMAGRFPGARSVDELWTRIRQGDECISFFSDEELIAAGVDPAMVRRPDYVKAGGILPDADLFDAAFFGFSPREAELLDPQHRVFLECAWQALEQAGYCADTYPGLIGVCAGMGRNSYLFRHVYAHPELMAAAGAFQTVLNNDKDSIALRTAYQLNLGGPAVTVQTACSTSLVAVHLACQCLLGGEADICLAGGVGINLPQTTGYLYAEGSMLSPDGHLRAFDARARGAVAGRGVGVVVLKRLADAVSDRDTILAVIKGTAINNDGSSKIGYTAPSIDGQARVIRAAHMRAGVEPQSIGYVEAHGTGTDLGDPIEVAALNDAFGGAAGRPRSCALGSLKSNIGHLDAAAGVASLIKTVLMLQHREIPASLHFVSPNPKIDFAAGPFFVPTALQSWDSTGAPRRAGVSSFGMGGTNAHAVVEEAPASMPPGRARAHKLLVLSAASESALDRAAGNLVDVLRDQQGVDLDDLAYTLQVGRKTFRHRRMVVCSDAADGAAALDERIGRRTTSDAGDVRHRAFAFMFPGQGTQYASMARGLFESRSEFRKVVTECSRLLEKPMGGVRLEDILYPSSSNGADATEKLGETAIAQPALFVVEYALARLLMSWGIVPQAMIGHSIGEWVAACIAGVFPLEKALPLVAARGLLMQGLPRGAMLAVASPLADVERLAASEGLSIAAVNGPESVVVAGQLDAIDRLDQTLAARNLVAMRLRTSHAFHSAMMAPVVEPFAELVARARPGKPAIPFVSNVSGTWITEREAVDPSYWGEHLRACVQFSSGVRELMRDASRIALEVGPGATLSSLARQAAPSPAPLMLPTLRRPSEIVEDDAFLLSTIGRLWLGGASVDFVKLHQGDARRRVAAPTYPFERQRFWVDDRPSPARETRAPRLEKRGAPEDWCYAPVWKSSVPAMPREVPGTRWLVFAGRAGVGLEVCDDLARAGGSVIRVAPGASFERIDRDQFVIDPTSRDDYERVLAELGAEGRSIERVAHLWGTDRAAGSPGEALERGLYSVLMLVQAIGGARGHQVTRLVVTTEGALQVMGGDSAHPELAAVHGLLRVIPQEYPGLDCTVIDLAPSSSGAPVLAADRLAVVREMTGLPGDAVVAVRAGTRWVPGFDVMRASGAPRLRQKGVYLITGGLSGLGLALAGFLARETKACLVLTTRSHFPAREEWRRLAAADSSDARRRHISAIQDLENAGATVSVETVDVCDADALRRLVGDVEARWGAFNGVIHAAGVTSGTSFAPIAALTCSAFEEQLLPKLAGARALVEVFRGRALDFCSFTSSVSTLLGGLGFGAYAAANTAMEAAVGEAHQKGLTSWMSVAWEGWNFDGEARFAVTPDEGVRAFARLISGPEVSHALVSTGDLASRLAESSPAALIAATEAQPLKTYPRPSLQNAYVAPKTPAEKKVAAVWKERLGVDKVGIHDNFFELGGHSLLASQVIATLRTAFGVPLPVTAIFEAPTVQSLARAIDGPEVELAAPLAMATGRAARRRSALKRFEADE